MRNMQSSLPLFSVQDGVSWVGSQVNVNNFGGDGQVGKGALAVRMDQ